MIGLCHQLQVGWAARGLPPTPARGDPGPPSFCRQETGGLAGVPPAGRGAGPTSGGARKCAEYPAAPRDGGVTLIELLVVLAILSLATVLAVPSLRGPVRTIEVRTLAHDLVSHLRSARGLAISRGRPVAVVFDVAQRWYRIETDRAGMATAPVRLPGDLALSLTTARDLARGGGAARMLFYPDGSSTGGRVVLTRDRQVMAVGVDWLTGLARIEATP